ncbi:MAG: helix-turn-helix transcriptional regulator [Clostridiales bacterium]|nr:helix-turn-helix transcriptional regulator [Clostridiales bacterium]
MYFDAKSTGMRIRDLRMAKGYTQAEVAKRLNIGLEHYKRVESGRRGCSIDIFIGLKATFDTSLDYLILGEMSPSGTTHVKSELEDIIKQLSLLKNSI